MIPEKYRDKDQYLGLDWYSPNIFNVAALFVIMFVFFTLMIVMGVGFIWVLHFAKVLLP